MDDEDEELYELLRTSNKKELLKNIDESKIKICERCGLKFIFKFSHVNKKTRKPIFKRYHINTRDGSCPRKGKKYFPK